MNECKEFSAQMQATVSPLFIGYRGTVTASTDSREWMLEGDLQAGVAFGLLLKPMVGDQVLFVEGEGRCLIVQILARQDKTAPMTLSVDRPLEWIAPTLRITAFRELELLSLGRISMVSKHFLINIADSLVQQAGTLVQKLGQAFCTVRGVAQNSAQQHIITATEDVRIDGKRINMG